MAFEKLVSAPKLSSAMFVEPATISLTKRGKAKLPSLHIGFKKELMEKVSFSSDDRISLLIGTGDDAGVARIVADPDGALKLCFTGAGGGIVHAGKTAHFGNEVRERIGCAAEVIDDRTIEIVLPPWATAIEG